jgi:PAS domain S-box-containing protein
MNTVDTEQLYRRIVETAREGIWVIAPDARTGFVNQSLADLLGCTADEMLGRSALDFVFDEDRQLAARRIGEWMAGDTLPGELRFRRKDGSEAWASVTQSTLLKDDGTLIGVLAMLIDITARKRAEEALRASEAELQLVADRAPVFIAHCDKDRRFKFVNEGYAARLGLRPEALVGKSVPEVLGKEAYESFRQYVEAVLSGREVEFEVDVPYESIGRRVMRCSYMPETDRSGRVQGWVAFITDVTERRRIERELRESDERFAKAFQASPLALTITSLRTGRLMEVNDTFIRLSGYTREEAVGRTTLELGLWAERADREAELAMVSEQGRVRNIEYRFRMKDGSEVIGLLSAERLEIGGEPCALTVIEDITERKRAESERAELLRREQEARRVAEAASQMKDEFLATLSHELRTPLNAIIGWSHMLSHKKIDTSLTAHAIEAINRNARSQSKLIEDLLDVSRIITGKLRLEVKTVDVLSVVDAAVDAVRPAAEIKGIRLEKEYDLDACEVRGDPTRLQQVVWNLLSNSTKFTPRGGEIRVKVLRVDSAAEITVSDTGQGISADFLPHVFDRFSQADSSRTRSHSGLGLGLSIVRYMVELHGGTVRAYSEGEGRGASFTLTFPLAAATGREEHAPGEARVEAGRNGSPVLSDLKILLVDDHADTREMLVAVLTLEGAEVRASATAREGFEALKDWRPDILVSDIGMPEEDGYSLIKKVRSLAPEESRAIPALALTGYASPQEGERARRAGYHMHLAKPAEPGTLVSAIARLAGRASGPVT